jgi:hypothetical protein
VKREWACAGRGGGVGGWGVGTPPSCCTAPPPPHGATVAPPAPRHSPSLSSHPTQRDPRGTLRKSSSPYPQPRPPRAAAPPGPRAPYLGAVLLQRRAAEGPAGKADAPPRQPDLQPALLPHAPAGPPLPRIGRGGRRQPPHARLQAARRLRAPAAPRGDAAGARRTARRGHARGARALPAPRRPRRPLRTRPRAMAAPCVTGAAARRPGCGAGPASRARQCRGLQPLLVSARRRTRAAGPSARAPATPRGPPPRRAAPDAFGAGGGGGPGPGSGPGAGGPPPPGPGPALPSAFAASAAPPQAPPMAPPPLVIPGTGGLGPAGLQGGSLLPPPAPGPDAPGVPSIFSVPTNPLAPPPAPLVSTPASPPPGAAAAAASPPPPLMPALLEQIAAERAAEAARARARAARQREEEEGLRIQAELAEKQRAALVEHKEARARWTRVVGVCAVAALLMVRGRGGSLGGGLAALVRPWQRARAAAAAGGLRPIPLRSSTRLTPLPAFPPPPRAVRDAHVHQHGHRAHGGGVWLGQALQRHRAVGVLCWLCRHVSGAGLGCSREGGGGGGGKWQRPLLGRQSGGGGTPGSGRRLRLMHASPPFPPASRLPARTRQPSAGRPAV